MWGGWWFVSPFGPSRHFVLAPTYIHWWLFVWYRDSQWSFLWVVEVCLADDGQNYLPQFDGKKDRSVWTRETRHRIMSEKKVLMDWHKWSISLFLTLSILACVCSSTLKMTWPINRMASWSFLSGSGIMSWGVYFWYNLLWGGVMVGDTVRERLRWSDAEKRRKVVCEPLLPQHRCIDR